MHIKKTLVLIFLIGLFLLCQNFKGYSQEKSLKVITYNIWNGYDWGKDEARRKQVSEWINDQNPSIVALQELCEYTPVKLAEDAKSWRHPHSILLKEDGYSVGLTSVYPIVMKEKIRKGMHHGALHCVTNNIDVFIIHLSPGSYQFRQNEAEIILSKIQKVAYVNDNYIVLGDFNSLSPIDADLYEPDGAYVTRLRESNKDKGEKGNLNHGNPDYSVMSAFLSFPLIDVCQPFTKGMSERGSFPGQVLGEVNNETKEDLITRLERIDYIMASPILANKCISAEVCNGKECYFLSDHYPVIAIF